MACRATNLEEIVLAYLREGSPGAKDRIVTMMKGSANDVGCVRQQRSIVVAFFAAAVVFVIWLIVTGQHEQSLWNSTLLRRVKAGSVASPVTSITAPHWKPRCPSLVHTMTTSPRSLARFMPFARFDTRGQRRCARNRAEDQSIGVDSVGFTFQMAQE